MTWLTSLRGVWRTLFQSSRLDRDLDDELREYVNALEERHREAGMPPAEARRTALVEFEGLEQTKEKVRDARIGAAVESVAQDVRFAVRGLRRNPAFAATAILTLALGIGATVAVFSIVRAVLLRPLPYAEPERLVFVWDQREGRDSAMSPGRLADLRRRADVLSGVAGFSQISVTLVGGDHPEPLVAGTVSTDFFSVLGVKAALGRAFDVGREHQRVAVLTHGLWQRQFGGDPSIVGRDIALDSGNHTVVGVLPRAFSWEPEGGGGPKPELWLPAPVGEIPAVPPGTPVDRLTEARDFYYLVSVARMKAGLGLEQVNAGLAVLAGQLAAEHPDTDKLRGLRAVPALRQVTADARTPLLLVLGAVVLVLAVACVNVANLLLGRTFARRGEVAVRLAIGAGRGRLARQFLAEALVLAGLAASLGTVFAHAALASLVSLVPTDVPRLGETRVDGMVLAAAILTALAAASALALVPVLALRRIPTALHEASRRTSGRHRGGRTALLIAEVAATVTVVVGAGLLIRSFAALQRVDIGVDRPSELLTFNLALSGERAATRAQMAAFHAEVTDRLRALPGVRAVGGALALPLSGEDYNTTVYIEGRPDPAPGEDGARRWDRVLADGKKARIAAGRVRRVPLFLTVLLLPAAALWYFGKRSRVPVRLPLALALLFFAADYSLFFASGKRISLSAINDEDLLQVFLNETMLYAALSAVAMAVLAAFFNRKKTGREAAASALLTTAVVVFLIILQVDIFILCSGPLLSWYIPGMFLSFKYYLDLTSLIAVGLVSLIIPAVALGAHRLWQPKTP